ncbi:copper resistance protein B [Halopseudomonas xinjiangensis]|nr:copper resistance protein B [Halopseudomonas xinjiangensis]
MVTLLSVASPVSVLAAEGHTGHQGASPPIERSEQSPSMSHSQHGSSKAGHGSMQHGDMDHSQMDHGGMQHGDMDQSSGRPMQSNTHGARDVNGVAQPSFIPALTDADRAAAFPAIQGHTVHDKKPYAFLLFDQLEYQNADEGSALAWELGGWWGGDIDRVWLRSEGERTNGITEEAEVHVLWGHAVGPWWELVGGVRQDFKPGSPQTWAAVGLQGMALYGLEVEATAYLGEGGQTAARLEAEYDVLLTNRLVLQPVAELNFHGKDDSSRGIGSGLSEAEAGLRLRYEIAREFAPYVGVSWGRSYGQTADFTREEGEENESARFVAGVRMWF